MPGYKTQLKNGKWRLTVSNGFRADGKANRSTKTIEACSERKADKALQEFYLEFSKKPPVENTTLTVDQFINIWHDRHLKKLSPNTIEGDMSAVDNHIRPFLGGIKLKKLTSDHVLQFVEQLQCDGSRKDGKSGKLSAGSIYKCFRILRAMLNLAVKWHYLAKNPIDDIPSEDRPDNEHEQPPILQKNDLSTFLTALFALPENMTNAKHKLFCYMSLMDACREGEHISLTWNDVDLNNKLVHINTGIYIKDGTTYSKGPKSKSSKRWVNIDDTCVELLLNHKKYQDKYLEAHNMTNPQHYVFLKTRTGPGEAQMPTRSMFYHWVSDFLEKNGLPHVGIHGFRRMAASYALMNNVPLPDVQAMLGHKDISTTNIYVRYITASGENSAEKMSQFHQSLIKKE